MPKGVYERTPEILEKLRENIKKATESQKHGEDCNCAMCRGKRGEYAGKNNPRYKHGRDIGWYKYHKKAREKKHLLPQECARCGWDKDLIIHHKDYDISNNSLSNLEHMCRSCHRKEHPTTFKIRSEQRPCEVCRKTKWYFPKSLKENERFFCSKECYNKWRKNTDG